MKHKKICSAHFEVKAYMCQSDIASSRLLSSGVPTIISCPNPPPSLTPRRPKPKDRSSLSPPRKRRRQESQDTTPCDETLDDSGVVPLISLRATSPIAPVPDQRHACLQQELGNTKSELRAARSLNYQLNRKVTRMKDRIEKLQGIELDLRRKIKEERNCSVESILEKLPPVPRAFFKILLRGKKKTNWKNEPKAMELCLSVFFRSSAAYSVLRASGFQLPHVNTLRRRFATVLTQPGLCPKLLEMIRLRALTLKDHEKFVTLSFDGMTLKKGIVYKQSSDTVTGFVDCSNYHHGTQVANQGVLLMIRSLSQKWKQIIGYVICYHNLPSGSLGCLIQDAMEAVEKAGLTIKVITMDQESSQWKWVRENGATLERPFILHGNSQVFIVADHPISSRT